MPTTTSPHAGQRGRAGLTSPSRHFAGSRVLTCGGQAASPWDGHSSRSVKGGLHPRAQHGAVKAQLGKGTEGFGAASSSWSSEWLMICAQGRTNPPLQGEANSACCARRRLCRSYLRQQPLSVCVGAGLRVQGVSIRHTKHSRSSSLCCRAPHSNECSASCATGRAWQIISAGQGLQESAQGRAAHAQGARLTL